MSSAVPSRSSQLGFQPSFLLLPPDFFGLRSFLKRLELSLNVRSVLFVLPTGCLQGALRLVDGLLPPLELLTLSGLFLCAFALAALLLLLESERGLPVGRLVVGPLGMLLRFRPHRPAACRLRNVVAGEIGRQLGVLFERSAGGDGTLQNDARRSHGRRDDIRILALLRRTLVKKIAVGTPRVQSRCDRRRRYRQIKEAQRSLVGVQLPRHSRALLRHRLDDDVIEIHCKLAGREGPTRQYFLMGIAAATAR